MLARLVSSHRGAVLVGALLVAIAVGAAAVTFLGDESAVDREGVVLLVDGLEVTERDLQAALLLGRRGLDEMRAEMAKGEDSAFPPGSLDQRVALFEAHDFEVAVLGGLVIQRATEAEARRQGFASTDEEVADALALQRQQHEALDGSPGSEEARATVDAMIDLVGEDAYWELIEEWQRRSIPTGRFFEDYHRLSTGQTEPPEPWAQFRVRLAHDAPIQPGPALPGGVSPADVRAFLAAALAIERDPEGGPAQ